MERKKIGKGKQEKKRYQRIGKEEIKLSVFTDYVFLYMEARLVFN